MRLRDKLTWLLIIIAFVTYLVFAWLVSPMENSCPEERIKIYEDI